MNDEHYNSDYLTYPKRNMFESAVKTAQFLNEHFANDKIVFKVKSKYITIRVGKDRYRIATEKCNQGKELSNALLETFTSRDRRVIGTEELINRYEDLLHDVFCEWGQLDGLNMTCADEIKEYLINMSKPGLPIDFSLIEAVYRCVPLKGSRNLSSEEKEHIAKGYIFNIAQLTYEYEVRRKKDPNKKRDPWIVNIDLEEFKAYKDIQTINNIRVMYFTHELFFNGTHMDYKDYSNLLDFLILIQPPTTAELIEMQAHTSSSLLNIIDFCDRASDFIHRRMNSKGSSYPPDYSGPQQ